MRRAKMEIPIFADLAALFVPLIKAIRIGVFPLDDLRLNPILSLEERKTFAM